MSSDTHTHERNSSRPWVKLKWPVPQQIIFKEFSQLQMKEFIKHRPEIGHIGWLATTLYGYGTHMTKSYWEYRGTKKGLGITEVGLKCPETIKWIDSLPFTRIYDARFLLIKPGGIVKPHIDIHDRNWLDPVSIAIKWPENCEFRFTEHGIVPFKDGDAFILNIHYEHSVINNSNQNRVNLLIHGKKKKEFWSNVI